MYIELCACVHLFMYLLTSERLALAVTCALLRAGVCTEQARPGPEASAAGQIQEARSGFLCLSPSRPKIQDDMTPARLSPAVVTGAVLTRLRCAVCWLDFHRLRLCDSAPPAEQVFPRERGERGVLSAAILCCWTWTLRSASRVCLCLAPYLQSVQREIECSQSNSVFSWRLVCSVLPERWWQELWKKS